MTTPTNPAAVVEQVDRDAAGLIALGQPFTCFDCAEELARAFARHRLLGIEQGRAEMREEAAKLLDGDGGKVIPLLSTFAPLVSGNNMPCMSGDARDRLRPHVRQRFDDRIASVVQALRANHHLKDRPDAG